jgi:hypothetical protein
MIDRQKDYDLDGFWVQCTSKILGLPTSQILRSKPQVELAIEFVVLV